MTLPLTLDVTELSASLRMIEKATCPGSRDNQKQSTPACQPLEGEMNQEETAQPLTTADFMQAVAQAGGPKAVKATFDGLRLANDQLDKDYDRILDQFPRHWIAMAPDGVNGGAKVGRWAEDC